MLHRAADVTGKLPDGNAPSQFNLEDAHEMEFDTLRKNKEMATVVASLKKVSLQFDGIANSVSGHRKELAKGIRQTHTAYVRLFERMLFIVLKLQRKKVERVLVELAKLRAELAKLTESNEMLQIQQLKLGEQNQALVGLNHSLHTRNDELQSEVDDFKKYEKLYYELYEESKAATLRSLQERAEFEQQCLREERAMLARIEAAENELEVMRVKMLEEIEKNRCRAAATAVMKTRPIDTSRMKVPPVRIIFERGAATASCHYKARNCRFIDAN
jgi:small-conductance mechanosensitive channel